MAIANRLKQYLNEKDINYREADELFGFSNGLTGKFIADKTNLGVDKIERILSACPDLNGDWLITGRGTMLMEDLNSYLTRDEKARYSTQRQQNNSGSKGNPDYEDRLKDKDNVIAALRETLEVYKQLLKNRTFSI